MNNSEPQKFRGARIVLSPDNLQRIMSADEAAKLLGVTRSTLNMYVKQGKIRNVILDYKVYYFESEITELLKTKEYED